MTVETAVDIAGLNALLPAETDPIAEGGAHLRLIKAVLRADAVRQSQMTAANVGLGNVDNTSDIDKPVSTSQAAADLAVLDAAQAADQVVQNAAQAYAEGLVVGLWDDRGGYDASVNLFPSTGGSGTAGAIVRGDVWLLTGAGTLGTSSVQVGQTIRALVDTPAQVEANWAISFGGSGAPDAPTAGADKYIKSNATADGWIYKTTAEVTAEVTGLTAGKAQQVDQTVAATVRAATTDLTGESIEGTLSDTGVAITAFHGVAGITYKRKCLGAGDITAGAGLTILRGGASITTAANDTFEVYMLTATTCEVQNYVRAIDIDTAADALAGGHYGQTWQNLTGGRALNTTYTNTTGRPIFVSAILNNAGNDPDVRINVSGVIVVRTSGPASTLFFVGPVVVPSGGTYSITKVTWLGSLNSWSEFR